VERLGHGVNVDVDSLALMEAVVSMLGFGVTSAVFPHPIPYQLGREQQEHSNSGADSPSRLAFDSHGNLSSAATSPARHHPLPFIAEASATPVPTLTSPASNAVVISQSSVALQILAVGGAGGQGELSSAITLLTPGQLPGNRGSTLLV